MLNLFEIAHAGTFSTIISKNPTLSNLLVKVTDNIIAPILAVIFVLAFVYFVYGMYGMISSPDDSEGRKNGRNSIMWGVIGMVIMLSAYGIIRLIAGTLDVPDPF